MQELLASVVAVRRAAVCMAIAEVPTCTLCVDRPLAVVFGCGRVVSLTRAAGFRTVDFA